MKKEKKQTLDITHPELAAQWDEELNGSLKPSDVTAGSNRKVHWILPYDDPNTCKHFDFKWEAKISNRAILGRGCPYLSGQAVWPEFNDLQTTRPNLAKQWHPTKNGSLKPTDVSLGMRIKVWWYLPYDDPNTGKHFDFEWENTINERVNKSIICPFLTGKAIWPSFNDLKTLRPELAAEWHPTKNGDLTPEDVTIGTHRKVWWYLPYDDPKTGKHFDFEWEAPIYHRTLDNRECPYLSNQKIYVGYNDLASNDDELVKLWHPTKNGKLTPYDVTPGSNKVVWWYLPYDDPKTGKHFDFEWESSVKKMSSGGGCPYLSGKAIWLGFNDLASLYPDIAREWHPTKNGNLKPTEVSYGSSKIVWWQVVNNGEIYEWQTSIVNRTYWGAGCPYLSGSNLEKAIYRVLHSSQIEFKTEQIFDEFKTKYDKYYRFDCYLVNERIIIECDGEQHFIEVNQFGGKRAFNKIVDSDNNKNSYAFKNNMPILRIPYYCLKKTNELKMIIENFIKTKTIPQEIIDFYSQFEFSNYVKCINNYYNNIEIEAA